MTIKEAAEVERVIEALIDAVKNGTTHPEPDSLEYTGKALDTIAEARKFQRSILKVALLSQKAAS